MPESHVRSETLRAGSPVSIGAVTLLFIERVVVHTSKEGFGAWFSAMKEPYAIIVRDNEGIRSIETETMRTSLEKLRKELPGFDTALASMPKPP